MVTESLMDTQPLKDLVVNSTCIESPKCDLDKSIVGSHSGCVQTMNGVINKDNLFETNGPASSGSKRARMTSEDHQALVHVRYEFLSRESKKKLEELLSDWSKWHAQHCSSFKDSDDALESGGETYFPALHCGTEKSTVCFLMETQATKKQKMECLPLKCDSVPLYDREYAFALKFSDGSNEEDRGLNPVNASRCFNCGSYSHSLKECPKPRDNVAVSNARKEHQLKKNHSGGPHVMTRYYQDTPRGKYDGLQPGALDAETRKLLGLAEVDPPPWLNRMRELGYPPGYLDIEDGDLPSGITIYDDEESNNQKEKINKVDVSEPGRTRSVSFPGINAPIPEDADQSRWASQLQQHISSTYHSNQWPNCSPELLSRGNSYSQRWRSDSTDGFFSSYARKLDSYLSNYSGYSHYKEPDFADNSESGLMDGLSRGYRHERIYPPGSSPSNGNYGPNYNSGSSLMDGFSGGRRVHESDVRSGHLPSANHSPLSIYSHNQFAYSRQI